MPGKIHFVHLYSAPGGIEVLLPVVVKNVENRSFSAFVIRPNLTPNDVYEDVPVTVSFGSKRNIPAFFKLFFYTIKNRKSVFHIFNIGPVFLLIMRLAGAKKIIYSIHGTIYWKTTFQKWVYRFLWKLALSEKVTITANSEYSRNQFFEKINPRVNIRVLYNPIDAHRFSPFDGHEEKDEISIIYSGRLEPGKNLQKWIEIASYVNADMPNTRFEIYGEGSLKAILQKQITAIKADHYIQLHGHRRDIENAYRSAGIFLFLSEYESFGNVVVECILSGTPVITLPIPVMKEIFRDFPQFVLSDSSNLKEQVLFKLLQLSELKKLSKCARESFLKRFSVEQHIQSLQSIYSECEK
jgi:glycosyltransferase involved in cell wall biosynthesis